MRKISWIPVTVLSAIALFISSCSGNANATDSDAIENSSDNAANISADDRVFHPSQEISIGEIVEFVYRDGADSAGEEVFHLHCEDEEALAKKADHNTESQPVGWPQDWDGEANMPEPYCHPDYLEIGEWENLEEFTASWEGIETSTLVDSGQPQAEINEFLWEQSRARADWTP